MSDYNPLTTTAFPVADPDLELKGGGGGFNFLALLVFLTSVISFLLSKIHVRGGVGVGGPGPSPRTATDMRSSQLQNISCLNVLLILY